MCFWLFKLSSIGTVGEKWRKKDVFSGFGDECVQTVNKILWNS